MGGERWVENYDFRRIRLAEKFLKSCYSEFNSEHLREEEVPLIS
jgi:hypothetical protein